MARRSCEIGTQLYPRDWFFVDQLRIISNALGQYEAGLKASMEMQRLVPPQQSLLPKRRLRISFAEPGRGSCDRSRFHRSNVAQLRSRSEEERSPRDQHC